MNDTRAKTGGLAEFARRWAAIAPLASDAIAKIAKGELMSLRVGEYLARRGDEAHCTWIIESGELDIDSPRIQRRGTGDLIGEAGLLLPGTPRSSDMVAQIPSQVWCVKREALEGLSDAQRADVYRVIATSLLQKLHQSVEQRQTQRTDLDGKEELLRAFVPRSGLAIIQANLHPDADGVSPFVTRQAVVLFSDLVGFSKLAKQLTPQETGAAVIALQTPVVRAISEHGGELDKLIGDGAMALWLSSGSDVPQHFANSAVAAAIAAVKGVRAVAKSAGWSGIDLRVGIHCGDVVVGDFGAEGRRTFTAIGPVVNTAARYEQVKDSAAAQFGQVRISPAVFARLTPAASSQFAAEPLKFEEKTPPSLLAHRLASPIGDDNGVE